MHGNHTNYPTLMTLKHGCYFSPRLIIPIQDKSNIPYSKANYYFRADKNVGSLIIRFDNKSDTIIFIKSTKLYRNINAKWG